MTTIEMSFALSAPARRALESLSSPWALEFIAELFFDKLTTERYRDFAIEPQYYTTPHGYRLARSTSLRPRGEKLKSSRARLTIRTFRLMKKLQLRGLALTWQLEEMLYFAFEQGLLTGANHKN